MKLTCSKSKNSCTYYVQKSVRIDGKSTTKTIERLGSIDEIKARCGNEDPIAWAKKYIRKLSDDEKNSRKNILINYSPSQLIETGARRTANAGYLFLQDIYYSLGLDKICRHIADKYKFNLDLNEILSYLVYSRIIYPGSKKFSLEQAQDFLEQPSCPLHHIYRGLEFLAKENDFIQSEVYRNSENIMSRKHGVLYYDCTNYYFEIEDEDDFRKYGISKEHRPNPIVQMGLFMDADGIPLSFSLFNGNENEQPSMTALEKKVISDYGLNRFVVCTDSGLSSMSNRKFNNTGTRKFVTAQSIKKLKGFLQDFCLSDDGWQLAGSRRKYNLSELDPVKDYDKTFFKDRWINENGLEQHLVVTFSLKYRNYQRKIREKQLERAVKLKDNPSRLERHNPNDPKRFITKTFCTAGGEIARNSICSINDSRVADEERYDGFYAVCTNLEDEAPVIVRINQRRWEIEECFRIMKSEFKARPVYLSRKDRITAHFMTCFISLIIYRILEHRLSNKYTCGQIIPALRNMNMLISPGDGYIPAYKRTDVTDSLHEAFGFRTDYQIISQRNMKKIFTSTKK